MVKNCYTPNPNLNPNTKMHKLYSKKNVTIVNPKLEGYTKCMKDIG